MIAFASVAVTADGAVQGVFEAVQAPLPGAVGDPDTLAWFQTQPEAWAAATTDPRDPAQVMADYAAWVLGRDPWACGPANLPPEWLGNHEHTHKAIDDARGYAHLLGY